MLFSRQMQYSSFLQDSICLLSSSWCIQRHKPTHAWHIVSDAHTHTHTLFSPISLLPHCPPISITQLTCHETWWCPLPRPPVAVGTPPMPTAAAAGQGTAPAACLWSWPSATEEHTHTHFSEACCQGFFSGYSGFLPWINGFSQQN